MNWFSAFVSPLTFEEKEENKLGRGAFGVVYRGTFKGNAVAVKVIVKVQLDDEKNKKREIEEHFRLDHENVLKLLHVDDSRDKTYLVLELCAGTLTDYCEKKYKGPELPPDGKVLYQIANGLHYIHSRNLVHRDVKPDNILISITTPIQMKLSDYRYVKKTSHRGTFTQQSGLKGTLIWMAPEILKLLNDSRDSTTVELPRGSIQSDTFAAGCAFFYFLTRGKHPFGNYIRIQVNIVDNNPIELNQHKQNLKQGDDRSPYELIGKMIKPKEQRISMSEVIIQMTTNLTASRQFKRVARLVREEGGNVVSRFHPKKPVIACGIKNQIIFFSAENSSIPFSNWKEDKNTFQTDGHLKEITTMEWNVNGTQFVAVSREGDVIVWDYPSGEILFQKKLDERVDRIEWNPFRPNLFATFVKLQSEKVFFFNSRPVHQRSFHFYTIEREKAIRSVQWISANRVAVGLFRNGGGFEIWEIDKSTTFAKLVKRLKHESVTCSILAMAWNERTKCLAACTWDGWMTISSMDSDQPIRIHTKKVGGICSSFTWRPNGKPTDDNGVDAARKSADNFILACGCDKGKIVIWTPLKKEKTKFLDRHSNLVESLSFSPDGRFLASADSHGKLIIWSAENWKPVYIGKEEYEWDTHFSWLYSSTDVPDYKLTFTSFGGKIRVIEYAVGQSEKQIKDGSSHLTDCQGITETCGKNSSESYCDLK